MSSATLVLGPLTLEGFFDRDQAVLSIFRDGQVVSRVPRDLYMGCFAVTFETNGQRWTLEAEQKFRRWRRVGGTGVLDDHGKGGWLASVRAPRRWRVALSWLVGAVTYGTLMALFEPGQGVVKVVSSACFFAIVVAGFDWHVARGLRRHLARQAEMVVTV